MPLAVPIRLTNFRMVTTFNISPQIFCDRGERKLAADRAWQALATRDEACLAYCAFDLLYLDGRDLCRVALERRNESSSR